MRGLRDCVKGEEEHEGPFGAPCAECLQSGIRDLLTLNPEATGFSAPEFDLVHFSGMDARDCQKDILVD